MADEAAPTRTERKRTAILDTATTLFLTNGFRGTTMDEIAAKAEVSKQTVYKQFEDKELLFRSIVDRITSNAGAIVDAINTAFGPEEITRAELRDRLIAVGRVYVDGVLVLPDSVFTLSAGTGPLGLLAHLEKTTGTATAGPVYIDRLVCRTMEQ